MHTVLLVIYYVLFIITTLYCLYFGITGLIGILKKNKAVFKESKKYNNFAILVPARNEEKVIGNLLESLEKLDYPKDKYQIYVIPNNCTDNTVSVAKKHNCYILDCNIKTKTKGDVLKFAFSKLKDNKDIDAYVIFDADNVVDHEFLIHLNNCLESGYRVAQTCREAKNPSDNWLSGSYTLFYLFQNVFMNRARMGLNASATINGTGFMIKKELIDQNGFETYTLTEDVEFTGKCALNNEKIAFVEKSVTYDEYPTKFKASWIQRKRWTAGNIECMKLYSWKLFKHFLKNKNLASLDMCLSYLSPLMTLLCCLNGILLLGLQLFNISIMGVVRGGLLGVLVSMLIGYLGGLVIELFAFLYEKRSVKPVLSGLFLFVLFTLSWMPINLICFIKKQTKWEEIKHTRSISISELTK